MKDYFKITYIFRETRQSCYWIGRNGS